MKTTSSFLERWIIGVLDAILVGLLVAWAWNVGYFLLQIVLIASAFALGLVVMLSVAAWRHGFRWFLSRRALRFYGWLVVGIISVIVLFYAEESWRGKRAWAALQREVVARGESLELSSVFPPPVPDDQNFALAPGVPRLLGYPDREPGDAQAAADTDPELSSFIEDRNQKRPKANWAFQQTTDLAAWQKFFRQHPLTEPGSARDDLSELAFPVAPAPQAPPADVLLALSRYDLALAVLRDANDRPKVRYPIAYEDGLFALHGPNHRFAKIADRLKAAVHILCLRAVAELAQDRSEVALEDTLLALRLANSFRQEPYAQLHRSRAAMLRLCLQPVWEGLAGHRWNDAQLLALQQRFADIDLLAEFRLTARGEAFVTMNIADQFQAYLDGRGSAWGRELARARGDDLAWLWFFRVAYPVGWLCQDKVWIYRVYERRADVSKALDLASTRHWAADIRRATDPALVFLVAPRLRETFEEGARGALYLQTACQQAMAACALERCRLAQGKCPASLDALVPGWLKQLPADLAVPGGLPLRYRREADGGFVLYSVGLNGVDEQGKPPLPQKDWRDVQRDDPLLDEGDWVWRQPGRS